MYVIFKDQASVILTGQAGFSDSENVLNWSVSNLDRVKTSLDKNEGKNFVLVGDDPHSMFQEFRDGFTVIEAAGGLVKNSRGERLLIFRHDTWDLPKGKIDPGETTEEAALREVREECGISSLELGRQLQTTYHIYEEKGTQILKVTYWYRMYSDEKTLTPQVEEGITELAWIPEDDMDEIFENTYPNIELLLLAENDRQPRN